MTQGNIFPIQAAPDPIDPGVRIGHVHLRTADIDRVRDFYVGVLGFDVVAKERDVPGWGTTGDVPFVSAGGSAVIPPDGERTGGRVDVLSGALSVLAMGGTPAWRAPRFKAR